MDSPHQPNSNNSWAYTNIVILVRIMPYWSIRKVMSSTMTWSIRIPISWKDSTPHPSAHCKYITLANILLLVEGMSKAIPLLIKRSLSYGRCLMISWSLGLGLSPSTPWLLRIVLFWGRIGLLPCPMIRV